jgi:NTE family protein
LDDDTLPEERRYKPVVTVADLTRGQLVRLPWDHRRVYGRDPDEQSVAHAVRASMAIPFFFRPVSLTSANRVMSTLVDGGLISNFPIDSLDRTDGKRPRWPTFGITVMPNLSAGGDAVTRALAVLRVGAPPLLERVITTMMFGRDQAYLDGSVRAPSRSNRLASASSTSALPQAKSKHYTRKAMRQQRGFLSSWDWQAYRDRFR